MTWRPLYVPQTEHAACGSFGDLHCGQATVATAVAFQLARRDRVLLRDILRLGTATATFSSISVGSANRSGLFHTSVEPANQPASPPTRYRASVSGFNSCNAAHRESSS